VRIGANPTGICVANSETGHRLTWRDRHLGLIPVAEKPEAVGRSLDALAAAVTERIDLDAIITLAASAPTRPEQSPPLPAHPGGRPARIAVAGGPAFTFTYTDTIDALRSGGAEVIPFDPLRDPALPDDLDGLIVGGGFPETHTAALADNQRLLHDVRRHASHGLAMWAECGGLLWLAQHLDGRAMTGVLPTNAQMTDRLTLGYRDATTRSASPIGPAGTTLRGHEFHYATVEPTGDALELRSRFGVGRAGFATPTLLASFLHHHPGGDPSTIDAFLATCREGAVTRSAVTTSRRQETV
jgi:cobyrinic acid a,c-diamide synthase